MQCVMRDTVLVVVLRWRKGELTRVVPFAWLGVCPLGIGPDVTCQARGTRTFRSELSGRAGGIKGDEYVNHVWQDEIARRQLSTSTPLETPHVEAIRILVGVGGFSEKRVQVHAWFQGFSDREPDTSHPSIAWRA